MPAHALWGVLVLPFCGILGLAVARVALNYAHDVNAGAQIDGATLRAALAAVCRWRERPALPARLARVCVFLSMMAGLSVLLEPSLLAAARLAACFVLLTLALIDARCGFLPDALTLPLLWAGLLLAWSGHGTDLHDAVLAAAAGYVLLWSLDLGFRVCRGRAGLGGGDMKLVAALGAWLGWAALPGVLLAACIAGAVFALCRQGREAWHAALPFGPFLALAGAAGLAGGPVVQFFL